MNNKLGIILPLSVLSAQFQGLSKATVVQLPVTHGCKEPYLFPLSTRSCKWKSVWGKSLAFSSTCFQVFVHSIMQLWWRSLVNLVSVMEDVTPLIYPTGLRMVKWGGQGTNLRLFLISHLEITGQGMVSLRSGWF